MTPLPLSARSIVAALAPVALREGDAPAGWGPVHWSAGQWALVLAGAAVALLGAAVVLLHQVRERLRERARDDQALAPLRPIESAVRKLAEQRDGLDLRRVEHVLIDIRDAQRRLEERLIAAVESSQAREVVLPTVAAGELARGGRLSERVTARLLAMGFERIEILTPSEELERLTDGDGELIVEARRSGAAHKGRVVLRDGAIADVRMRDGYEAFP